VPVTGSGPTVDAATLTAVTGACRDHERLRFDYQSHGGLRSPRVVEPYRLVNWGRRWYLLAWDTARSDWRTFRVDRITLRPPAGPRFTPREPPGDVADYVTRGVASAGWRQRAQVTVHLPAASLLERIPVWVGVVEPVDEDRCVLRTGSGDFETLAAYLGMLGADFTVDEPPELLAHVRALADRYRKATP
jgi:predicted DNA-binding transcriptional regulator YafY